jgi:starch phosphorylase
MKPVGAFRVVPALPPVLEPLRELAGNLWWCWNHSAIELFRRLDHSLWERTGHNPVLLLGTIDQWRLDEAAADAGFRALLNQVTDELRSYMASDETWFARTHGRVDRPLVAYFSAEFGLTECLSIFAGGLGLLAGDHLKSASDLGVPLVGVGLLYQEGYFRQYLNQAGWQQEAYVDNDFHTLPLSLVSQPDGQPLAVSVPFPNREVEVQVWRAQVGRIPLYLLDSNVAANQGPDRAITNQLYGGDRETRIQQELLLGIGGFRALEQLGLQPAVYHMNEGHSAFLGLARIRDLVESQGLPFGAARELAGAGLVFTTHTPVAAGHDYFPPEMMDRYLPDYARATGVSRHQGLGMGRLERGNSSEPFGMTTFALRLAGHSTAVSKLHGQVSRRMWRVLWPEVPEDEVPIAHVTNGVHLRSWISREMDRVYDRYVGQDWWERPTNLVAWRAGIASIPQEELWRTHELRRERLIAFTRRRLRDQLRQRSRPQSELDVADEVLDLDALTIGFARRFATYKRATLLLRDPARLTRLLTDPARPVQVLFAGKAHPRDEPGKALIQQVVQLAQEPTLRRRIVFLEDYDTAVARTLVRGCDVWLNTPRRPEEASGTSGMKAAANGVLNLSTLDGWWDEAWSGRDPAGIPIGWSIGQGESYADRDEQDQIEAAALYDLLERDVVPTFYDRGIDGLPRGWIARMQASISYLVPLISSHRMVREYVERCYLPAAAQAHRLAADDLAPVRELAAWRARVEQAWPQIAVVAVETPPRAELRVGDTTEVRARVHLGALEPTDLVVQLYVGRIDARGELSDGRPLPMQPTGRCGDASYLYEAAGVPCPASGLHGYTVRVLPAHADLATPFQSGLITWATPETAAAAPASADPR